MFLYIQSLQQ